jgi:small-conductance mechanosensitive channel
VLFKIGVRYETPPDKLAALPGLIRKIIESQHSVRFDRAHFQGFSDSSLDFEIVYFVRSSDYNVYMDIQQAINLELVRLCAAEEIDFAHPTQIQYLPRGEDQNSTGPSKSSS